MTREITLTPIELPPLEFTEAPPNPGRPSTATPEYKAWHPLSWDAAFEPDPNHPIIAKVRGLREALDATPEARWERWCNENCELFKKERARDLLEMRKDEALLLAQIEANNEKSRRSYQNRKSNPGRDHGKSTSPGIGS